MTEAYKTKNRETTHKRKKTKNFINNIKEILYAKGSFTQPWL